VRVERWGSHLSSFFYCRYFRPAEEKKKQAVVIWVNRAQDEFSVTEKLSMLSQGSQGVGVEGSVVARNLRPR
jgi:hypothetical protein